MNNFNTKNKANKNKRFAAMLAAAVITLSGATAMLTGCGSDTEPASNASTTSSSASKETTTGTATTGTNTTGKATGSADTQKADNTQAAGNSTTAAANGGAASQDTTASNADDIKVGIDRETAISNVKTRAGSGAEIISCTKGYSPDGLSCWIVVVSPVTNGSTPEKVTYYSGYQFCYPDKNDLEPVTVPNDGQNPMMNFIGTYTNGRATMTVSCSGKDQASISITWSSNVAESSTWTMSGPVTASNDGVSMTYTNCTKQSFTYSSDGTLVSSTTDYENGNGSFDFSSSDYNAYWYDAMENAGANSSFWLAN